MSYGRTPARLALAPIGRRPLQRRSLALYLGSRDLRSRKHLVHPCVSAVSRRGSGNMSRRNRRYGVLIEETFR